MMRFVDPKNDVAFKKIFGNEEKKEILISFLNAVLDLQGAKEIEEIDILNPFQTPTIAGLKSTILDVRAKDKRGVTFIVEMQVEKVTGALKRFQYYAAKAYVSQIKKGEKSPKLNQVILIAILDYIAFEDDEDKEKYLSRHVLADKQTHKQHLKELELNFIELPKFTKKEEELITVLEKWIYFIKHVQDLEVVPESADTEALQAAYEMANQFSWTSDELEVYDYWGIRSQDERGKIEVAQQEALRKGRKEGRKEGQKEGRKEGRKEGKKEGRKEGQKEGRKEGRKDGIKEGVKQVARNLLRQGLSLEQIATATGLSVEQIAALEKESMISDS